MKRNFPRELKIHRSQNGRYIRIRRKNLFELLEDGPTETGKNNQRSKIPEQYVRPLFRIPTINLGNSKLSALIDLRKSPEGFILQTRSGKVVAGEKTKHFTHCSGIAGLDKDGLVKISWDGQVRKTELSKKGHDFVDILKLHNRFVLNKRLFLSEDRICTLAWLYKFRFCLSTENYLNIAVKAFGSFDQFKRKIRSLKEIGLAEQPLGEDNQDLPALQLTDFGLILCERFFMRHSSHFYDYVTDKKED
jgi:hypothetical protein